MSVPKKMDIDDQWPKKFDNRRSKYERIRLYMDLLIAKEVQFIVENYIMLQISLNNIIIKLLYFTSILYYIHLIKNKQNNHM